MRKFPLLKDTLILLTISDFLLGSSLAHTKERIENKSLSQVSSGHSQERGKRKLSYTQKHWASICSASPSSQEAKEPLSYSKEVHKIRRLSYTHISKKTAPPDFSQGMSTPIPRSKVVLKTAESNWINYGLTQTFKWVTEVRPQAVLEREKKQLSIKQKAQAENDALKSLKVTQPSIYKLVSESLQIGDYYLAKKDPLQALKFYQEPLKLDPSNPEALDKIQKVASILEEEKKYEKAIQVYSLLIAHSKTKVEPLCNKGRLLSWIGEWKAAEKVLDQALNIDPNYFAANMQLAQVYMWTDRFKEAEKILNAYPSNTECEENLAKIDLYRGNYEEAEKRFKKLQLAMPQNKEIAEGLFQTSFGLQKYLQAKGLMANLVKQYPHDHHLKAELFNALSHTDIGSKVEFDASVCKETDALAKVVKTRFNNVALSISLPLHERVLLSVKPFFSQESQLFNTLKYYDIVSKGELLNLSCFLPKNITLNLQGKWRRAEKNHENALFSFEKTKTFEPALTIHKSGLHYNVSAIGGYDFITIKKFSSLRAELLKTKSAALDFDYQSTLPLSPFVGMSVKETFYSDAALNKKNEQSFTLGFFVPHFSRALSLFYGYDTSHFKKVTQEYNSWKKKEINSAGVTLKKSWNQASFLTLSYVHSWPKTSDFSLQDGDTILNRREQGNYYKASFVHQINQHFQLEGGAYVYDSSFPYNEKGISGRLEWVF